MSDQRYSPFYIGKKDLSENITVNISHWSERRQLGQQCKAQMTNLHLTAFSEQAKDNAAMFEQRNSSSWKNIARTHNKKNSKINLNSHGTLLFLSTF